MGSSFWGLGRLTGKNYPAKVSTPQHEKNAHNPSCEDVKHVGSPRPADQILMLMPGVSAQMQITPINIYLELVLSSQIPYLEPSDGHFLCVSYRPQTAGQYKNNTKGKNHAKSWHQTRIWNIFSLNSCRPAVLARASFFSASSAAIIL